MHRGKPFTAVVSSLPVLCLVTLGVADDWPTYLHDIQRSGVTAERLSPPLHEQWVLESRHAPTPAWADPQSKPIEGILELPRLRFDDAYHVVAVGDTIYFGSSADHTVYALDAASGEPRWSFITGGPVRLAPTLWQAKLYVGSDDGFVYCLDAATGRELWRFQAAPHPDQVLGNGQLISLWPVRTSVLVDNGIAYFGAGVFPAEGLYLYAVNAETGSLVWKNDAYDQGGIADVTPQGYLLASPSKLFVPSGRAVPGAFDRANGLSLYQPKPNWRQDGLFGGTYALLAAEYLYNGTEQMVAYQQEAGKLDHTFPARRLVVAADRAYLMTGDSILAVDPQPYAQLCRQRGELDGKLAARRRLRQSLPELAAKLAAIKPEKLQAQMAQIEGQLEALRVKQQTESADLAKLVEQRKTLAEQLAAQITQQDALAKQIADAHQQISDITAFETQALPLLKDATKWKHPFGGSDALILAGDVLFAAGGNRVVAIDTAAGNELWSATVNGKARGLAVANGRLLVSTDTGHIHCFASTPTDPVRHVQIPATLNPAPYPDDEATRVCQQVVDDMVKESGIKRGYALILGGDARLALELAKRTELSICLVQPDADQAAAARQALRAADLYGVRVRVDQRPLVDLPYPPYFANLIVAGDSLTSYVPATPAKEVLRLLKPHGGVVFAGRPPWAAASPTVKLSEYLTWRAGLDDGSTQVQRSDTWAHIIRGALPGAGNWTHQYADAANTTCGDDHIIKGPLGILWFGEPGPTPMPSRHASNVAPLVVNGRLVIQGENLIMAYDAYNGVKLWERQIPGALRLGMGYTSESGNLAASDDTLFVAIGPQCLRLDLVTGQTRQTYALPEALRAGPGAWGYIAYVDGTLYGSRTEKGQASSALFALDVQTAQPRWTYDHADILDDSIAIGDGKLFLVDKKITDAHRQSALAASTSQSVDRKGQMDIRLAVALDARTGQKLWDKPIDVSDCVKIGRTGGELSAIYARNVLLLFGAPWDGHFWSEFLAGQFSRRSLIALAADSGKLLWSDQVGYRSRPIVVGDTIYAEPWAHDLLTGQPKMRTHPLTGEQTKWQMARPGHHCGCIAASPNCLFFRSYSTAFYDLLADYGIAHYGAQRPGCWINFIPAGGVLCIPEASSGCVCPIPMHCTIVMHPRDLNRVWGMYSAAGAMTPIKHLAINFGAPGDRKDANGQLWLGYPRPRRDRLVMNVDLKDELHPGGSYYHYDSEGRQIEGAATPWVFTSWCKGLKRCSLPLLGDKDAPRNYTVRLYFAELGNAAPGQRVFNVALQGQPVLTDFDVAAQAGRPNRALLKEFPHVHVKDRLEISLTPSASSSQPLPILCAVEVQAEP